MAYLLSPLYSCMIGVLGLLWHKRITWNARATSQADYCETCRT
ncbi:hypothetical protein Mnod_1428 [Methylobacterium nodulans ORS 2060]|uniref:Uncharacterized protein n=1 Tax=Methylobacterium nodulans (strain LMG 21967 / CNCM I-2342 / ORS 2060) TaxID=460265 RepID=B8IN99_METNO|nr:hypothetical protein Mnod_1428 [Methylobacterium nodulans ORS 2060]